MNKLKVILALVFILVVSALSAQESERWYAVSIGGNPVGYFFERHETVDEQSRTLSEMNIKIGRLGSSVEMETKSTHFERNGKLTGINSELNISNEKKVESVEVKSNHLLIQSQGHSRELPLDTILSGPKQIEQLIQNEIANNRNNIRYTTYAADFGMYITGIIKFIGAEKISINGTQVKATIIEESFVELPVNRKKWVNDKGELLKSAEPNPFGEMEVIWTSKENALYALNNSVELPEDQYGNSMAYSNIRLPKARSISSIKIKITHKKTELGFPNLSGDYQHIISKTDNEVILQIKKPNLPTNIQTQTSLDEYLAPNAYLDNNDELLIQKSKEIIGDETDEWEKAKLITKWVSQNMSFDPGIALADSREVMRDLKGTCISYAMLSATLCKAVGLPARYLMGYVYVDGAWGGHAWVEVNIKGHWIPIDAAVPNESSIADAARFHMLQSSLKSGVGELNIAGLQLFSNIDVEILEYSYEDKTNDVTTKTPYRIERDTYINDGLKFSMAKLPGFEFSDLGKFYPEEIVLKQKDSQSEITLEHISYGLHEKTENRIKEILNEINTQNKPKHLSKGRYEGLKIVGTEKSVAVIKDGPDFLLMTTTGSAHSKLLDQALEKINFVEN